MTEAANIPSNIRRYIAGFVARRRRTALLRRCGVTLSFVLLWLLLWTLVDRVVPEPGVIRLMLLACNVVVAIVLLSRPIKAILSRRFDWRAAAAQIEQRDPRFIGKLETSISQLMLPPELRGSSSMLQQIVEQANSLAGQKLALPLVPMEPALRPWLIALATALLMAMLAFSGWLDLPQLLQRALCPLGDAGPVTTTRLFVETGDANIPQGGSLTITARAQRLPSGELTIHLRSDDGNSQSAQPMLSNANGGFSFVLNSIDHDWQYQITGGDARSRPYTVRVLRPPAIAVFHIRYIYPAYMGLPPSTVSNHDGLLQAPIGTQAIVDLVSTEPLQTVALIVNAQRFTARATNEPNTYEASIPIKQSGPYQLQLRSVRGVTNARDETAANPAIESIPDQPPQPRWEFAARNLFVSRDAGVALPYRVTDDYGADSVSVQIDAANQATRTIAVSDSEELQKDQFGQAMLSVGGSASRIGQVLSVRVNAVDAIKQRGSSVSLNLIVAPHAVDADDHLRIASLNVAAAQAQSLEDVAGDALRSEEDSLHSANPDPAPRNSRMIRASVLARQIGDEMMRAISHTHSKRLADGMIELVDRATAIQVHSRPFVPNDDPSAAQIEHDALAHLVQESHQLRTEIETIRSGEVAAAAKNAMDDFQSLLPITSSDDSAESLMLRQALEQSGREVDADLKGIGVDPDDFDLEDQLVAKISAADELLRDLISNSTPAERLSKQAAQGTITKEELNARLTSMARAQAVYPDADFAMAAKWIAAAGGNELPAFDEAAALMANDLAAAEKFDQQLHAAPTSKPSADAPLLMAVPDAAAERALTQAKSVAASGDRQKIQSADREAARRRIEALVSINSILHSSDEQSALADSDATHTSTTQPIDGPHAIAGFDEPLRLYFQALKRTP